MNLQPGMTLYYLNRDCYNPNEINQLIVPLTVTQDTNGFAATSQITTDAQFSLPLTPQQMVQYTDDRYPTIFHNFTEAKSQYEKEINTITQRILTLSKEEIIHELNVWRKPLGDVNEEVIKKLYQAWKVAGSALPNELEVAFVKKRIAELFDVNLEC